jgi:hypothetical protein
MAFLLATTPVYGGGDEPEKAERASEVSPAAPGALCCALPADHGLRIDAEDAYQMLGVQYDPQHPLRLDPVEVSAKLSAFKRKCSNDAEWRTAEVIEILTERKTHALYDWFLLHLRANPEGYQGTALEHVALFDQFFLYLSAKRGRSAKLDLFDYQEELVRFLETEYRASDRYDVATMKAEVDKARRDAEVAQKAVKEEFKDFYNMRAPWIAVCAAALVVAGGVALFHVRPFSDGVAPVEQRLPQVIDRDTLRHPVAPPSETGPIGRDPAFQHGREAADDLFGAPTPGGSAK